MRVRSSPSITISPPARPALQVAIQPETKARPSKTGAGPRRGSQPSGRTASMAIGRPPTCGTRQVTRHSPPAKLQKLQKPGLQRMGGGARRQGGSGQRQQKGKEQPQDHGASTAAGSGRVTS